MSPGWSRSRSRLVRAFTLSACTGWPLTFLIRRDLLAAIESARVWVADVGIEPAAYAHAEVLDGNAHVAQVSVAAEYAGRRIGRTLIRHVEAWGRERGSPATTLTTFRDMPWNAPYYARLGYRILDETEIGPDLARTIAHEAELPGVAEAPRCAMVRRT